MTDESRALVDPEVAVLIDTLPLIDLSDAALATARERGRVDPRLFDTQLEPRAVEVERHDGPPVGALLFDPPRSARARGAILHLHGGGMVMGSPDMARIFMPEIALRHELVVMSVDYRLAPETVFPGQLDDAEAALHWLIAQASDLAVDPARILLMGESAGGGLAAALALRLRDRGGPGLAGQILTYPMLDHRTGGANDPHDHGPAGQFIWTAMRNRYGWDALRGGQSIDRAQVGWFSPATAKSLAGLPPTFLATGSLDLFLAENLEFARRLCAAGNATEFHTYSGAIHGFDLLRRSRLARQYRRDLGAWLDALLAIGIAEPKRTTA
ncbi:alpha/beta hydrolase [Sphingopyxis sp. FD7]|uniref:alpha/beta hydrolase n=1 Tax=Sphingopyxis sp. FD7 TaxID=1914525 RepID=UPI000DC623C5|nr:alpha/beta hydrolase [Sphingopyxis sp. FD7]BBB14508.1 lipase [Sphingopyxis sp. FD7]